MTSVNTPPKTPEVDFNLGATGITIISVRFLNPRFIPYDVAGRCTQCKSDGAEIDYVITSRGITLQCTRMKGPRYVLFDFPYLLPNGCWFRIKTKGRIFNIPYDDGSSDLPSDPRKKNVKKLQTVKEEDEDEEQSNMADMDTTLDAAQKMVDKLNTMKEEDEEESAVENIGKL
jgi:hypothetical protein